MISKSLSESADDSSDSVDTEPILLQEYPLESHTSSEQCDLATLLSQVLCKLKACTSLPPIPEKAL